MRLHIRCTPLGRRSYVKSPSEGDEFETRSALIESPRWGQSYSQFLYERLRRNDRITVLFRYCLRQFATVCETDDL